MSTDDPFSNDNDRTVLRPIPGGRRSDISASPDSAGDMPPQNSPPMPQQEQMSPQPSSADLISIQSAGKNPLVNASATLFSLVVQLRGSMANANVASLKTHISSEIQKFETEARNSGVVSEQVTVARYALCTMLDETVMNTPWGNSSDWSEQSLLSIFHRENLGGEKFFTLIDRAMAEPIRNIQLLEFMYVCLALGFEGKYGVINNGKVKLEDVRENLYRLLRTHTAEFERDLSPNWRSSENRGAKFIKYVPLWVVAATSGVLLLSLYVGFSYLLSLHTDPVLLKLDNIGLSEAQIVIEK